MAGAQTSLKAQQKRELPFLINQAIVTISVDFGDDIDKFNVHKDLLISHSGRFREELKTYDRSPKILLDHTISAKDFDVFLKWLYTGEFIVGRKIEPEDEEDEDGDETLKDSDDSDDETSSSGIVQRHSAISDDEGEPTSAYRATPRTKRFSHWGYDQERCQFARDREGYMFERLLDLYVFAMEYEVPVFKLAVMLEFQRYIEETRTIPDPTLVTHALKNLGPESPMYHYLVQKYGHDADLKSADKNYFAKLPSEFFMAVLMIVNERMNDTDEWEDNWCEYHEHETWEGWNECQNSRSSDADLQSKPSMTQDLIVWD